MPKLFNGSLGKKLAYTAVAAVAATASIALPLAGIANASGPTPTLSPDPSTGYTDGQTINISVPANTYFTPGAGIAILECTDPGGTIANLPSDSSNCDGETQNADTLTVNSDGSFSDTYSISALPNQFENPNQAIKCNATSPCVLYIGQNQGDFTQPKVFSAPFFVSSQVGASTPETPFAVALPLSAGAVMMGAGYIFWRRRRESLVA